MVSEEQSRPSEADDANQSGFTEICENIIDRLGEQGEMSPDLLDKVDAANKKLRKKR